MYANEQTQQTADNTPSSRDRRIRNAFSSLPSKTASRPITDTLPDDITFSSITSAIVVVVIGVSINNP